MTLKQSELNFNFFFQIPKVEDYLFQLNLIFKKNCLLNLAQTQQNILKYQMINMEDNFIKLHVNNPLIGNKTFQFSPKDSVSDLRNTVCQTTEFMMYQNFHFEHQNKILSEFLEMGQTLISGAKINIVFNSFDQRSSKFHYNKIKSLLQNPTILANHNYSYDQNAVKKETNSLKFKLTENIDSFLKSLQNQQIFQPKIIDCEYKFSQWLNFSGYNPVPYYRKMMGDYYYIYFKSPEESDFHITGHTEGFFVNQSTNSHFNPNISSKHSKLFISLLDLLYTISPKFKELFKQCLNKIKSYQYQKFFVSPLANKKLQWLKQKKQISNQGNSWKINPQERNSKRQEILTIKDWNQMFQIQHLQPSQSLYEKINRQKLKFKIYQQFVDHAKIGAISIIDKLLSPVNPNCPKSQQTFIFTNIYYQYIDNCFEQKDLNQLVKANQSQFWRFNRKNTKITNNYILNLEIIDNIEGFDFHLSHSVLIQYKGQKLRAQSFPSGLIHTKAKNQKIQVVIKQKSIINSHLNKNILLNPTLIKDFNESLMKLAFKLNLQFDNVVRILQDQNKYAKKIAISSEIHGIKMIDKRKYLFNLHTLLPKDYNFVNCTKQKNTENLLLSSNDHLILRPQLIALYNEKFRCRIPINTMLGKTLEGKYELIMNQRLRVQEKKLKSMANFAKDNVINMVIAALQGDLKKSLADTKNIVNLMHKFGLNCRYIGFLYKKIDKKKSPHLQILIQKAIYIKCIKNILNTAIKSVSHNNSRQVVAHILNCIFYPQKIQKDDYFVWKSSKQEDQQQQNNEILKKKKKKNKQKEKEDSLLTLTTEQNGDLFLFIKPIQLSKLIRKIAIIKFNHSFQGSESTLIQPKIFRYLYGKASILRDICLNSGIVLERKQYFSDSFSSQLHPFIVESICSFQPRCTHTHPDKKELQHLIGQGDQFLSQFLVEQSIQSYNKAIQYILTTFGGNNQNLPLIHKKLSFIYFKIGDIQTALLFGSHSLGMFEEFYGLQHVQTIDNLAILGIYHCAERNFQQAQQCLFRALYYAYLAFGEVYPQILTLWLNLSTIFQIQKNYAQAIMCIFEGLKICLKVFTQNHLNTAIYYAALSSLHLQIPDIMNAIKFKQKSLSILQKLLPQSDNRIKQSTEMLEYLRSLQSSKKIKQIHEKQLRKMINATFGYHPPQMGTWEYNGRNARGNPPGANMIGFGNKNFGKMQQYFLRQSQEFWRRTSGAGRRIR